MTPSQKLEGRRELRARALSKVKVKTCKCCGIEDRPYKSEAQGICDICLGKAVEIFGKIEYWPPSTTRPTSFTLHSLDGTTQDFVSINSAATELGVPAVSIWRLVVGVIDEYKGMTSTLTTTPLTLDDIIAHKPKYY